MLNFNIFFVVFYFYLRYLHQFFFYYFVTILISSKLNKFQNINEDQITTNRKFTNCRNVKENYYFIFILVIKVKLLSGASSFGYTEERKQEKKNDTLFTLASLLLYKSSKFS